MTTAAGLVILWLTAVYITVNILKEHKGPHYEPLGFRGCLFFLVFWWFMLPLILINKWDNDRMRDRDWD